MAPYIGKGYFIDWVIEQVNLRLFPGTPAVGDIPVSDGTVFQRLTLPATNGQSLVSDNTSPLGVVWSPTPGITDIDGGTF